MMSRGSPRVSRSGPLAGAGRERLPAEGGGKKRYVSLTTALIIFIGFAAALLGTLAFVMTRPKHLRPHRPNWRRIVFWRRAREGRLGRGGTA
jgi:hypothetical protein